jgi:hypothetical protein
MAPTDSFKRESGTARILGSGTSGEYSARSISGGQQWRRRRLHL